MSELKNKYCYTCKTLCLWIHAPVWGEYQAYCPKCGMVVNDKDSHIGPKEIHENSEPPNDAWVFLVVLILSPFVYVYDLIKEWGKKR